MMKCEACRKVLEPVEALRVDGKANGKPVTFFVHRPSQDGRCFRQAVFGSSDVISLVELAEFEPVQKSYPYFCPACSTAGEYYGRLVFQGEESGACPNPHFDADGKKVESVLVPVSR